MVTTRRSHYDDVSAWLAARDDAELAALVNAAPVGAVSVGGGHLTLKVNGVPVFAKRIPITDRETAHPHRTANLFDVPTSCQYGMHRLAGPGFNAWRELAANLMVTAGIQTGEAVPFPLLYHWRVLPGRPAIAAEYLDIDAVVAYFGDAMAVRGRLDALAGATCSLVLFFEHIPSPLHDWWHEDPAGRAETVERQLFDIVAILRNHELLHMDGHLGNMRAAGDRIYLTDFGLATSRRFELTDAERAFVARHLGHDADYAAMLLVNWLVTNACGVPLPETGGPVARNQYVRRCAAGDIPQGVPPSVTRILARHAPAAARMNDFVWRLFAGDIHARYHDPYPAARP